MERSFSAMGLDAVSLEPKGTVAEPAASGASWSATARPCFEDVYAQHFDLVWRSLRHLGVPAHVLDDAAQDVWLVVHRRLADFDGRSAISTWLFGISINVARARRRAREVRQPAEPLPEEVQGNSPDPAQALESSQAWNLVQGFLAGLSEVQRAIFVSSLLENFSPAETARATGLDVGTVYRRVRALRRSFQRFLKRNEEAVR